jgi:hypothetical protein
MGRSSITSSPYAMARASPAQYSLERQTGCTTALKTRWQLMALFRRIRDELRAYLAEFTQKGVGQQVRLADSEEPHREL